MQNVKEGASAPNELRSLGRIATMVLPFGIALLVASWFVWTVAGSRQEEAGAYASAESALDAGNYDAAIEYFAEAGSYRDAAERRSLTQELLAPVRSAYLDAMSALERSDFELAIALLEPIAESMPDFEQVVPLLNEAQTELVRSLEREVDIDLARRDWMGADRTLVELINLVPDDPAYVDELTELRRSHAPIIFARSGKLVEIGPTGEDERLLFDDFAIANPLWSPDRRYITFLNAESARSQVASLYLFEYESGTLTLVSDSAAPNPLLAWRSDGSQFVFVTSNTSGLTSSRNRTYLSLFDLDSGEQTAIYAPHPDKLDSIDQILNDTSSPTWSPDGTRLAFIATHSPASKTSPLEETYSDIQIVELESGEMTNVTQGAVPLVGYVTWSPVSDQLLTWEAQGGTAWFASLETVVRSVEIATGEWTRLTQRTEITGWPSWSPDGQSFAVIANSHEILVRSLDGMVQAQAESSWALDGLISWSPSGDALLATAREPGEPSLLLDIQASQVATQTLPIEFDGNWPNLGPQWSSGSPMAVFPPEQL